MEASLTNSSSEMPSEELTSPRASDRSAERPAEIKGGSSLASTGTDAATDAATNSRATPPPTSPQDGKRYPIPGLPEDYCCYLQPSSDPMAKIAGLQVLGDRRNTASLGLFVVVFFGLTLTLLALGEALRLVLPAASLLLDMVMTLTLLLLLVAPVALAAMLGISLGQAIRQPKQRVNPDLEKVWLLQRGNQTVGKLRLLPEALRQQLLWVHLEPKYRGQGIGRAFVSTVLQAEGLVCRVKVSCRDRDRSKPFFQRCGFKTFPGQPNQPHPSQRRSLLGKSNSIWLVYDPF